MINRGRYCPTVAQLERNFNDAQDRIPDCAALFLRRLGCECAQGNSVSFSGTLRAIGVRLTKNAQEI